MTKPSVPASRYVDGRVLGCEAQPYSVLGVGSLIEVQDRKEALRDSEVQSAGLVAMPGRVDLRFH